MAAPRRQRHDLIRSEQWFAGKAGSYRTIADADLVGAGLAGEYDLKATNNPAGDSCVSLGAAETQSSPANACWASHPPPSAAINCTLATSRPCSKFSTLRSLLSAVVCTFTTSR